MVKRIFITDSEISEQDNIRFELRQSYPMSISGLSTGSWKVMNTRPLGNITIETGEDIEDPL